MALWSVAFSGQVAAATGAGPVIGRGVVAARFAAGATVAGADSNQATTE